MDIVDLIRNFLFLFVVLDPIGSIPVFLEATKRLDSNTKNKIALKSSLVASFVFVFFIVVGQLILEAMHISISAFQISGGVILFLFALTMVFGEGKPENEKHLIKDYKHIIVFPIAIPSIASPGALMAVVLLTDNHTYTVWQQVETTLIVMLVLLATYILLRMASKVQDIIGEAGITIISKIMGFILAAFAIQSILTGLKTYFNL